MNVTYIHTILDDFFFGGVTGDVPMGAARLRAWSHASVRAVQGCAESRGI